MIDQTHIDLVQLINSETGYTYKKESNSRGGEYAGPCPFCGGTDRFRIQRKSKTGQPGFYCRQCDKKGDAVQFIRDYKHMAFPEACRYLKLEMPGKAGTGSPAPKPATTTPKQKKEWEIILPVPDDIEPPSFSHYRHGVPSTVWEYKDTQGRLMGFVARHDPPEGKKQFIPHTYCKNSKGITQWRKQGFDEPKPLYGLDRLATAEPDTVVIITEGEKSADAGQRIAGGINFVFLSWFGGTGQVNKADFTPLKGRAVILWPDNDEPGIKAMNTASEIIRKAGGTIKGIIQPDASWPEKADLADFPTWNETDVFQAAIRANPPGEQEEAGEDQAEKIIQQAVDELNESYAVIWIGGKLQIMRRYFDPIMGCQELAFSSISDFKAYFQNKTVKNPFTGKGHGKQISKADLWLNHKARKEYQGLGLQPPNKEGKALPSSFYNLWRGFGVKPVKGDWRLYQDHVFNVVVSQDDELFKWVMAWLARLVQDPGGKKPGTSIVLMGDEGIGKGTFLYPIDKIFGNHFIQLSHQSHLTGNFNGHLKDKVLVFADEAFWGGNSADEGNLKRIITESELQVEHKGKDTIKVKNFVNIIMASNNDWCVPAGLTARRFLCLDVPDTKRGNSKYFRAIRQQLDSGGIEAMLYDLLHYDYSGVDLTKAPKTKALLGQMEQSMLKTPVLFWLYEGLTKGELFSGEPWPESEIEIATLKKDCDALIEYHKIEKWNKFKSDAAFSRKMKKLCPDIMAINKVFVPGEKKARGYIFPSLSEQRKAFEEKVGMKVFEDEKEN